MQQIKKNNLFLNKSEQNNSEYIASLNGESRKSIGQVFTPAPIARFMADMFTINSDEIKILDPGAGTGVLTAALCDRLIHSEHPLRISVDAYENDAKVLPFLKNTYQQIEREFDNSIHHFKYNILSEDFIEYNSDLIDSYHLFSETRDKISYNFIVSNPPYYKLQKSHRHSLLMKKFVHGQPNIYFFFMALSSILLDKNGQLVFITPRSYCSGLYFKRFRKWFLEKVKLAHIHTFESRRETFNNEVLQETIIIKGIKKESSPKRIIITSSYNSVLTKSKQIKTDYENIIQSNDPEKIIHIPSNNLDLELLSLLRSWKNKFSDLGFRISTGPVVSFRAIKYLNQDSDFDGSNKVPLLWMQHLNNFRIKFPNPNIKKPQTINVGPDSAKLLLKNKNYVLVKRFSSKEQKKRIYAAYYSKYDFPINYIGIENHLNYVWKPHGELSTPESLGLMALLNSSLIDKYFRILNGNTQVNASEINNLPFPSHDKILEIGKSVDILDHIDYNLINSLITDILGIPKKITELIN